MWKSFVRCICVSTKNLSPIAMTRPVLTRFSISRTAQRGTTVRYSSTLDSNTGVASEIECKKVELDDTVLDDSYYRSLLTSRYVVLGKSVLQSCMIEHLLNMYQDLDASKIADLAAYFTKEVLPLSDHYISPKDCTLSEKRAKMYAEIGMLYETNGQFAVFQYVKGLTSYQLNEQDIDVYCKLAHSRATLDAIVHLKQLPLEVRITGKKSVGIFINNEMVKESTASTIEKAEYEVCLSHIKDVHLNDIKNVTLDPKKKVIKKKFKGKFSGQRVIELSKGHNEHYGLFLKGGEKDTIETEKFLRYNYVTPIYISRILPGGPADQSGLLQEGDVILAVGDFTLSGLTLKSAIMLINQENTVSLTVRYDPNIKLKEKMISEFKQRENKAFKDTLKTEQWRKWHESNVENQPGKYITFK